MNSEADSLVPADGTYVDGLPDVGAIFKPDSGLWKHLARTWRGGWVVAARTVATGEVEEIAFCRKALAAAREFQRARREVCQSGQVVEAYRGAIGGWALVDRGPALREACVAARDGDHEGFAEFVWGQDGTQIGVTRPMRPGSWELLVPGRSEDGEHLGFGAPGQLRDYAHGSRVEAIRAAERLAPSSQVADDDGWLQQWSAPVARFQKAGIGATFGIDVEFLGATGTFCAAPACSHEALVRLTSTGSDVGSSVRLACNRHAGEALARQTTAAESRNQD